MCCWRMRNQIGENMNELNLDEKKMFEPLNRHLLIEKVDQEEPKEDSLVLVPDDYKLKSQFGSYKVICCAPDCEKVDESYVSRNIVVEESMVQKISLKGETYYLVLENYVYGLY